MIQRSSQVATYYSFCLPVIVFDYNNYVYWLISLHMISLQEYLDRNITLLQPFSYFILLRKKHRISS